MTLSRQTRPRHQILRVNISLSANRLKIQSLPNDAFRAIFSGAEVEDTDAICS